MRSRVLSHVSCISRSVHPEWPRPQLGGLQCFVGDDGLQIVDLQEYERYLPTHLRANDFQSTRQLGQSTSQTRQILVGMQSSRTLQSTPITTTPIHDHHNHSNPRPSRSLHLAEAAREDPHEYEFLPLLDGRSSLALVIDEGPDREPEAQECRYTAVVVGGVRRKVLEVHQPITNGCPENQSKEGYRIQCTPHPDTRGHLPEGTVRRTTDNLGGLCSHFVQVLSPPKGPIAVAQLLSIFS